MSTTWAAAASNQVITDNCLKDAVTNSIFGAAGTTIPTDDRGITKANVATYIYFDQTKASYAAKSSSQLVVKADLDNTYHYSCGTSIHSDTIIGFDQYAEYDVGTTSGTVNFYWTLNQHSAGHAIDIQITYGGTSIYTTGLVTSDGSGLLIPYTYSSGTGSKLIVSIYQRQDGTNSTYVTSTKLTCPAAP